MTIPPHSSAGLLGLVFAGMTASGQVMLSPVAVLGSDLGSSGDSTPLEHMIDHSGVENAFISGSTAFEKYFSQPSQVFAMNGPANNWQSDVSFDLPLTGYVDFDLGASYTVVKLAIWNVAIKDVTVRLADTAAGLATGQVAGSFVLTNHWNYPFSYAVDVLPLTGEYQTRYVRLSVTSAYLYSPSDTYAFAIVGEVVASVIPAATVPPTIQVVREANGDVTLTFTGRLQRAPSLADLFVDVPGNPQSPYTIPSGSLAGEVYFRSAN